jgi:hypothetical protein
LLLSERRDICLDGQSVARGCFNDRHISQAEERHVEGSRNRRGRQGEDIDALLEMLEALLVSYSKALLLIDDNQSQILELNVAREDAVSADEHVDRSRLHFADYLTLLLWRPEA